MRILCSIIILLCINSSFALAQDKKKAPQKQEPEQNIFVRTEIEAHTDTRAFMKYIMKHAQLSDSLLQESGGNLTVIVSFIVDQYGRVTDVKAEPEHALGAMAAKIIRNYPGIWTPAVQCGRAVKSYKKQRITFCTATE